MNVKGSKHIIKSTHCKDCGVATQGTRKGILCSTHRRERKNENNRVYAYSIKPEIE